jgi:hypothetical protein
VAGLCSQRTEVGWAARHVAEERVDHEGLLRAGDAGDTLADGLDAVVEAAEDSLHITALLHRDDADVVTLVEPVDERLLVVVEDAAPHGPTLVVP